MVLTMTFFTPKPGSSLHLKGVEVKMFDEIDHHIVGKLLGFTIPLCREFAIQCQAFSQLRTAPREIDEFFQSSVSNGRVSIGAKIATWPIHDDPYLPEMRFGMFDDPPCHFTEAPWSG